MRATQRRTKCAEEKDQMRFCQIYGSGSDIALGLASRLRADDWTVEMVPGRQTSAPVTRWNLLILAHGSLEPIGRFFDVSDTAWRAGVHVNGIHPLRMLRLAWPQRLPNATVVFISGPNMNKDSPTYTAYRAGKAILESLVGSLNAEYQDTKFRMLRPGVVNTKIHQQTIQAGKRAANHDAVVKIVKGEVPTVSHDEVYEKLKSLI